MMLEARWVSISVERPWRELYDAIWRPDFFPRWASGLSASAMERDGAWWKARGPEGPIRIRFTDHNPYGVMDHEVDPGSGPAIHVPMRVIPNGAGAEVVLTLFRQPGMPEERFLADAEWVRRDLLALKSLVSG
ncbi:polyketide cyclase [Siccirubricoccus sp. KC 17139]|uniref:Polyketide cyclase n=1 Tax=Siccirubricoccus soli TaxID=2899147 RepID=A0ABT1DC25_9PROT|nr:polyketide cyclase [Siccirubricoccus soli]MCO6419491.1 polyketide cyclase [Siccirubricoccus soli]MCP2685626.1 polyketide cyclase [Siccirubricoccus soli]